MKLFRFVFDNILFILTLFLLAFIPLYPKLPLIDIQHTWVYIRAEDFFVLLALSVWLALLIRKKITLKNPLILPILAFWIIGALATIHGLFLIFPNLTGVHTNVAFLSYLRRIEYISLFFVAFSSVRDKRILSFVVGILTFTLLSVAAYGFGQKYLGFKAYLTMNEEFAKGVGVQLSSMSRIPSTFGGHYDLAAYLVLIIPLLVSVSFGIKNWFYRLLILGSCALGFVLLLMTVSRVSFVVLIAALLLVLILYNKRFVIALFFVVVLLFFSFSPGLLQRFGNTLKQTDVMVSAQTGEVVGNAMFVPRAYLNDKIVNQKFAESKGELTVVTDKDKKYATSSAFDIASLSSTIPLVVEPNAPTGESLPQGTGYINIFLSPIETRVGNFFYQQAKKDNATQSAVLFVHGDYLIKKSIAYDLSFTTRFQGEWPQAIKAFQRNILVGSGYSSVGLAVDNNYLRILAEVGLLGFVAFFGIFLMFGIYVKRVYSNIDSPFVKSFIIGVECGIFGLFLNAIFIDVFEASKIAYLLWLLIGITVGLVHKYQKETIDLFDQAKKIIISTPAIVLYLFIITGIMFSGMANYFFVGDDFTWLRWVADCGGSGANCHLSLSTATSYFTNANGFFYRPGTKLYFLLMYSGFWFNQTVYHLVSILLHASVVVLVFLIAKKILKSKLLSMLTALLFVFSSGYGEAVFWVSSVGFLFNAFFTLLALLLFIIWREQKKIIFFVFSFACITFSLLFHELGIVAPLFVVFYIYIYEANFSLLAAIKNKFYFLLFLPLIPYLFFRLISDSHWFSGDYSFNIIKLPYNIIGNLIGYLGLIGIGPIFLPIYGILRNFLREHLSVATILALIIFLGAVFIYRKYKKKISTDEQKIVLFSVLFFITALLPFLGLGNITSRYSYLASIGLELLFAFFIKKLYMHLLVNGRNIAIVVTIFAVCIFSFLQLIQLQKVDGDWHAAGNKSIAFFTSLDSYYENTWRKEPTQFYFVDVPIRLGEAWIFPVGLPDAVWFVTRNGKIQVYQTSSIDKAIAIAHDPLLYKNIFIFQGDGDVKSVIKTNALQIYVK
ncbi:MAG: O-antigen ligase family protein [Candidatus Levyibacteriota bacterium]|nr:MAG: O-antigen ligase family protein [Candidatus Levybacteria bacterium]